MKRFSFRLQSVLRYRQYLERLAQQETAKANMDVQESQNRIEALKKRHIEVSEALESVALKGVTALALKRYHDYLDSLHDGIKLERNNRQRLQAILIEKQSALANKRVDREVVERLREKKESLYMDGLLKEEQKIIDEISSLKKAREVQDDYR